MRAGRGGGRGGTVESDFAVTALVEELQSIVDVILAHLWVQFQAQLLKLQGQRQGLSMR